MKIPSRKMPQAERKPMCLLILGSSFIIFLLVFFISAFYSHPVVTMLFITIFGIITAVGNKSYNKNLKFLAKSREVEPYAIGNFAKSFDCRKVDTWVIRAVYEEIQKNITGYLFFPLNPQDRLEEDLRIDDEELDFIASDIYSRTGRLSEDSEINILYDKVKTVGDLVMFFNYQPRIEAI